MIRLNSLTHSVSMVKVLTFYTNAVAAQQASSGGETPGDAGLLRFKHSHLMETLNDFVLVCCSVVPVLF